MVLQHTSHNSRICNLFIWEPLWSACRHIKQNLSSTLILGQPLHDNFCSKIMKNMLIDKSGFAFAYKELVIFTRMNSKTNRC